MRTTFEAFPRPISARTPLLTIMGLALTIGLSIAVLRAASSGRTAFVLGFLAALVIALAVGNLQRLFLGILLLDIPLRWDANLSYDDEAASLGAIGGYPVSATTVALVGLYTLWAIDRNRSIAGPLRLWPALPLAAYVGATALSLVTAADRDLGVFQLTLLFQTLLVFVYVSNALRTRKDIVFAVAVLVVGFLVEGVIMLGMAVADLQFDFAGLGTRTNDLAGDAEVSRLGGTVRSANGAAAYVAMMIPITLSLLWADVPAWVKRLGYVALPVGAVALILTYSRGGWAAALAGVTVLMLIGVRKRITPGITVCLIVVSILLIALPFKSAIENRLVGETQGAAYADNARLPLVSLSWRMIEDRPLLGVGANNFGTSIERYAGPEFTGEWLRSVHNAFLLVWAEAGPLALAAFLWFIVSALRRGWRVGNQPDRLTAPLGLGFLGALVGAIVTMGVERFIARPLVQLLVVVAAVLVALDLNEARGANSRIPSADNDRQTEN